MDVSLRRPTNGHNHAVMTDQLFQFKPRWKEELVVTANGKSFVLELPMGRLSAYTNLQ
jgi:hypothetical protein